MQKIPVFDTDTMNGELLGMLRRYYMECDQVFKHGSFIRYPFQGDFGEGETTSLDGYLISLGANIIDPYVLIHWKM